MKIVGLIPQEHVFKMNIDTLTPFWHDWEWSFGHPFTKYDFRELHSILHQHHQFGPVLNARRVSSDAKSRWI
jgi:hypothetical protein